MEWLICLNTTFVKSAVLQFQCCVSCWLLELSCCTSCHYYCCRCVILAALCMCVGNSGGDWEGQIPSLPLLLHINTQRLNVVLVHFIFTLNHCIYRHLHLDQQRVFNMPDARWSSQRKQQQRPFTIKAKQRRSTIKPVHARLVVLGVHQGSDWVQTLGHTMTTTNVRTGC